METRFRDVQVLEVAAQARTFPGQILEVISIQKQVLSANQAQEPS
jgi:hypothetical protein